MVGGGYYSLSGVPLRKIFQNWVSKSRFARQSPHSLSGVIILCTQKTTNLGMWVAVLYLTLSLSGLYGLHMSAFFLGTHPAY